MAARLLIRCLTTAFVQFFFVVFIQFNPHAAAAADLTSDRKALLAFTASVPHTRDLNWTHSPSICRTWTGVSCSDDNTRVTALRLPAVGFLGKIPQNTLGRLDALQVLSLRSNKLSGSLPADVLSLPQLRHLFLQHNNFRGSLPALSTPSLNVLDLSFNHFSGGIPDSFHNLTQLTTLYLQNNSLSGPIPNIALPKLRRLNLSYNNNLNGSLPSSFLKFPNTSFVGVPLLCGLPLVPCLSPAPSPSPSASPAAPSILQGNGGGDGSATKMSVGVVIAITVGVFTILMVIALIVFICMLRRKDRDVPAADEKGSYIGVKTDKPKDLLLSSGAQEAERNKLVFFHGCTFGFDLEDLLSASAEVLGKGSYGTAYKAILDDGTVLVVKRLKEVVVGKREFEQQMQMVGGIGQHPNVLPLRAYFQSKTEKLLVYDYLPAGSLCSVLHENTDNGQRMPLNWDSRVKILLGAANGISYLHSKVGAKFVHGNIRSSNVLLTKDGDGCISDFGLAPIMNPLAKPRNVAGYQAPEVLDDHKFSQKSDIYSFGVLLLEMLTGKAPFTLTASGDAVDLPGWVQSVVREEWTAEVFDVELSRYPDTEEEMVQMLQVGIMCVASVPEQRPSIGEVIALIQRIRQPDSTDRSTDFIDLTPFE